MASISLRNLTKRWGAFVAVDDQSIEIRDQEFLVLLGPSGCGKTTTMRMIAGLEEPTAGEIRIGGRVVNDELPRDRDVAMVFQNYGLYPHMTVRDNIAYPLKVRGGRSAEEIRERVRGAAAKVQLEELLDRKPRALSGGQRQRVALARAIVRTPQVFLMDEPLSNLDAKLRVTMRAELKHLSHELRITTVYVTHDQIEAMTLADRVAVMNHGRIQQLGTPEEIYDDPKNLFVAGFIGSPAMNLVEGGDRRRPVRGRGCEHCRRGGRDPRGCGARGASRGPRHLEPRRGQLRRRGLRERADRRERPRHGGGRGPPDGGQGRPAHAQGDRRDRRHPRGPRPHLPLRRGERSPDRAIAAGSPAAAAPVSRPCPESTLSHRLHP